MPAAATFALTDWHTDPTKIDSRFKIPMLFVVVYVVYAFWYLCSYVIESVVNLFISFLDASALPILFIVYLRHRFTLKSLSHLLYPHIIILPTLS